MAVDFSVIHRRVRDSVILNLRENFSSDSIFTYKEMTDGGVDPASGIWINDVTPMDAFGIKIPSIIVETITGDEVRYLSDEFIDEERDGDNVVLSEDSGTSFTMNINIRVLTESTPERDQLLDKLYNFLKLMQDILAANGVAVIKIDFIPEGRETIGTREMYTSGFTMPSYVEWVTTEAVTENVEAVVVDIVVDEL